ncbi:MAG: DUF4040 domain-containing protein [Maricaulaceae bacterium]|jgi:multicomponent Na+:H+ antiporter subunit B
MTAAVIFAAAAAAAEEAYRTPLDGIVLIDVALLGLMLVIGVAIVLQRSLFAVAMYSGVYSLLSAAFFVSMDAVDVAFTEAAVGAGISTVLMLGAMLLTARDAKPVSAGRRIVPLIVVLIVGAVLMYATGDMPALGDPESPANAYVGRSYLVRTPLEVGPPNVVTAVLASYRGYDTLGETVVIFTAGLGVMLLLGLRAPNPGAPSGENGARRNGRPKPDDRSGDRSEDRGGAA